MLLNWLLDKVIVHIISLTLKAIAILWQNAINYAALTFTRKCHVKINFTMKCLLHLETNFIKHTSHVFSHI